MSDVELTFIDRDQPQWGDIDKAFKHLPRGPVARCPHCGEAWQYMGTCRQQSFNAIGGIFYWHEFRHRCIRNGNGVCGKRLYVKVNAGPLWKPPVNQKWI